MMRLLRAAISVLLAVSASCAFGRDAFLLTATSEGVTGSAGFTKIEQMADSLSNEGLARVVTSYTPVSAAIARLDIRGLPALANYSANSTTLAFMIPSININESFTGATRDESQQLFLDWLQGDGKEALTRMLQELAAVSPIDPVAGNPNSLMALMATADFDTSSGFGMGAEDVAGGALEVGARFGRFTADDFDTDVYTVPINYTFALESDPRKAVIIDAPLTYIDNNGSDTYNGSLGVGFRFPLMRNWDVTPMARVGAVGSEDLGSAAAIYSLSATSSYRIHFEDIALTIGNMLAQYWTTSISAGDYNIDYDLQNTVLRNGIGVEGTLPFKVFGGEGTSWQLSLVDTRFFGDDLYVEYYDDIALSVGRRQRPGDPSWKNWRLGITGTWGENNYKGARLNFGYRF